MGKKGKHLQTSDRDGAEKWKENFTDILRKHEMKNYNKY